MKGTGGRGIVCVAGTAALLWSCAFAGCRTDLNEAATAKWHLAKTARFEVLTDGDPERAQELVRDMERLHQVMLITTTAQDREAAPPLRVFLTRNAYTALGGPKGSFGVFKATSGGNYALVDMRQSARYGGGQQTLFHEYVHYIMAIAGVPVPSWYNEGIAQYMSTVEFDDDDSYVLGKPPAWFGKLTYARWIPMSDVFAAQSLSDLGGSDTFAYGQAWYAVHYFSEEPLRQAAIGRFLKMHADGVSAADALPRALGVSMADLNKAIRSHATRKKVRYLKIKSPGFELPAIALRTLSKAEGLYHVGSMVLHVSGPTDKALDLLQQAAKLAPADAHVQVALGRTYLARAERVRQHSTEATAARANVEQAQKHLARAQAAAPGRADVLALEGNTQRQLALQSKHDQAGLKARVKRARRAYRKAIRADEAAAEAYVGLGFTYLIDDNGSKEATVVLEAAHFLVPLDISVALALARVEFNRGNYAAAIAPLVFVRAAAHGEKRRAQVERVLDEVKRAGQHEAARRAMVSRYGEDCAGPESDQDEEAKRGSLPRAHISKVIQTQSRATRACYQQVLKGWPKSKGRLSVKFTIATDGHVSEVHVAPDSGITPIVCCIVKTIGSWSFDPPEGNGIVVVTYPFEFGQLDSPTAAPAIGKVNPVGTGDSETLR